MCYDEVRWAIGAYRYLLWQELGNGEFKISGEIQSQYLVRIARIGFWYEFKWKTSMLIIDVS